MSDPKTFLAGYAVAVNEQAGGSRYRLSGATAVFGKNAGVEIQVYGANGVPVSGLWVVNLFPDGHGDDPQQTSASGKVQFDFGPASAYTPPASGPYRILITDAASKDDERVVHVGAVLSDIIAGLGDVNGVHSFWSLQFVEHAAPPVADVPTIHTDDELRRLAYARIYAERVQVSYNPDAALSKTARERLLGVALASEGRYLDSNGVRMAWQPFAVGILRCPEGQWDKPVTVNW